MNTRFCLGLMLFVFSGCWSSIAVANDFALTQAEIQKIALSGCVDGFTEGAARGFMNQAAADGKAFASLAEAQQAMTSQPSWKSGIEPKLHRLCECTLSGFLASVRAAKNESELYAVSTQIISLTQDLKQQAAMAQKVKTCTQNSGLDNLNGDAATK